MALVNSVADWVQLGLNAGALVTGGVEVSELSSGRRSLEDVFIELTGTESGL